jgi:hypothetical protein
VYELLKDSNAPKQTLDQIAKQFNVSPSMLDKAGVMKTGASEAVQQSVRNGTTRLGKAVEAVKKAKTETGIKVTKHTSEADKKKVRDAADRIIQDDTPPPTRTPSQQFQDRVLSGEFDGRRWQRNVAEIQDITTRLERFPVLYNDCYDLLGALEQESLLNMLIGMLCDTVKRVKAKLQRNDAPDFSEVIRIVSDMVAKHFPDIADIGQGDKRELNEYLKDRLIADCDAYVEEAGRIRNKLMGKHGMTKEDESEMATAEQEPKPDESGQCKTDRNEANTDDSVHAESEQEEEWECPFDC